MYIKRISFIILTCGWFSQANAQFSISSGKLFIENNSMLSVQADFHNAGQMTQEGTLALNGNWKNNGNYSSQEGTIILSGTGQQSFDHNGQSVKNITITNNVNVRLPSDLQVAGELVLEKGIITPGPGTKLVLAESASIKGGSTAAYINGTLYHTGNGNKFYPIGKDGEYAPVTLAQVSGQAPVVGLEFFVSGLSLSADNSLEWLGNGFYWQLTSLSGEFEGSPVHLNIDARYVPSDTESLLIAVSNNLAQGFGALSKANFKMKGVRFEASTSLFVKNSYFTLGLKAPEKNAFYIPNVLSPLASDPEDRAVKIYSEKISTEGFQWVIRDQWGHVVYTTGSYTEAAATGWEGKVKKGKPALPGIYYYTMKGKFNNGESFSKKGNLVLIE